MIVKAGDWKKFTKYEKMDLLIHASNHDLVVEHLKEGKKNPHTA